MRIVTTSQSYFMSIAKKKKPSLHVDAMPSNKKDSAEAPQPHMYVCCTRKTRRICCLTSYSMPMPSMRIFPTARHAMLMIQ